MATWPPDELARIGSADEMELASERTNGTLRNPVTIWVVRVGDDLYARSVNGPTGAWYRGTQETHEGHVSAGGVEKDVTFVDADADRDPALNDQIDAAYRSKYRRYSPSIVNTVLTPQARGATLKLVARS